MIDITGIDWKPLYNSLHEKGFVVIPKTLSSGECNAITELYDNTGRYRNVIDMKRYRFGQGEYKYFNYPLPAPVAELREMFYPLLVPLANEWMTRLSMDQPFPKEHQRLIDQCHGAQQTRPTPLLLRYEEGGFNTLHQDLYGEVFFPFQVVIVLSQTGKDFSGGEFVLVENHPRAQSKAHVISPDQGDAVIFTTNFRPVQGTRGYYRARMKHGVSEVTSGRRFSLGIIFHDAK